MTRYNLLTPDGWHVIKPELYRTFSILSTELVPCIRAYAIDRDTDGYDVVSVFDYGPWENSFFNELKVELNNLAKNPYKTAGVNDYIEENAQDYAVKRTNYMEPLFYKSSTFCGMPCFINIMKIITNVGESYSLQTFFKVDGNCLCFGTSASKIDEENPFNSIITENPFISDMFYELIKKLGTDNND